MQNIKHKTNIEIIENGDSIESLPTSNEPLSHEEIEILEKFFPDNSILSQINIKETLTLFIIILTFTSPSIRIFISSLLKNILNLNEYFASFFEQDSTIVLLLSTLITIILYYTSLNYID